MVFPTEETPFRSDNTTELFNSGQPLPHPHSRAWVLSRKTLWGHAAGREGSAKGFWLRCPNLSPVTAVCRLVLEGSNAGTPSDSHSLLGCGGHSPTPWHTG